MAILTPVNGIMTDPNGQSVGLAPKFNSNVFSTRVADMLTQLQDTQQKGAANLGGAANTLTTTSIGAGGAYNPQNTPEGNIANVQGAQGAFTPAITSINTQLQNANTAAGLAQGNIGILEKTFGPESRTTLNPGQTLVNQDGSIMYQGHSYTPQIRLDTGQQDSYDTVTGTWLSDVKAGKSGGSLSSHGINASAYNRGVDPNYNSEIDTAYNHIEKSVPTPSALGYDNYIQTTYGKKAPVTGQMIMSAAQTYGVDPTSFAAMLGHETDFGMSGESPKNNNPGGILWANQAGATQGSARPASEGGYYAAYSSVAKGVNAAAQLWAKTAGTSVTASTPTTSPTGGNFSPEATQKIAQLPASYHPYVDAGPKGVAYINSERIPPELTSSIKIQAAKAGIPVLDPQDVTNIKAIGVVYQAVQYMQLLVQSTLNSGAYGAVIDSAKTIINSYTNQNAFPELARFNSFRDTAIKAVQALAGGQGSGLRLNGSEIIASTTTLPDSSNTIATANQKITGLLQLLDTNLASTFPYLQGGQPGAGGSGGSTSSGGTTLMTDSSGKQFNVPNDKVNLFKQNGYNQL